MVTKIISEDKRVETGALQIGDDWPGVFIRGDEALSMADNLEAMSMHFGIPHADGSLLRRYIELLRSARVSESA